MGQAGHMSVTGDGNATKSRGTRVPLKYGYFTSENMPCSAWPNSWNVVVTSSQVSSVGLPSGGLGMVRWLAITGCVSIRSDWVTELFLHAPPRFDARAYGAKLTLATVGSAACREQVVCECEISE